MFQGASGRTRWKGGGEEKGAPRPSGPKWGRGTPGDSRNVCRAEPKGENKRGMANEDPYAGEGGIEVPSPGAQP